MKKENDYRNFKYKIEIDENGSVYSVLPEDYEDCTEDKFMIVNLCASILEHAYESIDFDEINEFVEVENEKDVQNDVKGLGDAIEYLSGVAFSMGEILKHEMEIDSNIKQLIGAESIGVTSKNKENDSYDIAVKNVGERNALPNVNIISGDNIYKRIEGFRVYVKTTRKIYELQGGTTNKHWKIVG